MLLFSSVRSTSSENADYSLGTEEEGEKGPKDFSRDLSIIVIAISDLGLVICD